MVRGLSIAMIGLAAALQSSVAAQAAFHSVVIDEVMAFHDGYSNVQFIEMRMLAPGQNLVAHTVFAAFDAEGDISDILEVPADLPNGLADGRWLLATSHFETRFGLTPDFIMPWGEMRVKGGMICFGGGSGVLPQNPPTWNRMDFSNYVDCVAYGNYVGPTNALIGTPTPLNARGRALRRVGVSNNNAADFVCSDTFDPETNAGATLSIPATNPCGGPPCSPSPDVTCGVFTKGTLKIKDAPPGAEKLLARFFDGPAMTRLDFGNPTELGGTIYTLCVYDDDAALIGKVVIDRAADGWQRMGDTPANEEGYKYSDREFESDGVYKARLLSGTSGKARALINGRGPNLPDGMAAALLTATGVTIQLHGDDAPTCLSANLNVIKKQTPTDFRAND